MKKKRIFSYFAIILLFLIVGSYVVVAAVNKNTAWHDPKQISVVVDGQRMTVQEAIDTNAFIEGPSSFYSYTGTIPDPGHTADQILITVRGYTMTLQEAADYDIFNLGVTQSYTTSGWGTHSASSIEVEIDGNDITLEDAFTLSSSGLCVPDCSCAGNICVNNFCTDPNCGRSCQGTIQPATCANLGYECGTWNDGCGGTLNCGTCTEGYCNNGLCEGSCVPGTSRWKDCDTLDTNCIDYQDVLDTCGDNGEWTATCNDYTFKVLGTTCNEGSYNWSGVDGEMYNTTCENDECACDGLGTCKGYSENGCDACPFGWELGESPVNSYKEYNCINPYGANPKCESYKCDGIYLFGCWVDWTFTSYDWVITPA